MLLRLLLTTSVAFLGACHVDFGDSDRFHEDFHYSYKVSPGSRLAIDTQNGGVDISTWDRDEIEINGTKTAATEDLLKALRIDIDASPNAVRVRVDKPSVLQGNCGVRFAIRVPKKLELEKIKSSNGGIQVNGVEGPADLQTSNGRIEAVHMTGKLNVQTSNGSIDLAGHRGPVNARTSNGKISGDIAKGWLEAHTSNGGIDVQVDEIDSQEPLRLETSNGNISLSLKAAHGVKARTSNSGITVKLPEKIDAILRARTSNSRVETDFVDMDKRSSGSDDDEEKKHKSLDAKIGAGGPVIDLSTSNGNIRILKRT